jgi:hypothetical protein
MHACGPRYLIFEHTNLGEMKQPIMFWSAECAEGARCGKAMLHADHVATQHLEVGEKLANLPMSMCPKDDSLSGMNEQIERSSGCRNRMERTETARRMILRNEREAHIIDG